MAATPPHPGLGTPATAGGSQAGSGRSLAEGSLQTTNAVRCSGGAWLAPKARERPPEAPLETVDMSAAGEVERAIARALAGALTAVYGAPDAAVPPTRRRERDTSSRKLGGLAFQLRWGLLSPAAVAELSRIGEELDAGRAHGSAATRAISTLTTTLWDESSFWLPALKRVIKAMPAAAVE